MGIWGIVGMGGHNVDARSSMVRRGIRNGPSFRREEVRDINYWKDEIRCWTSQLKRTKKRVKEFQKLVSEEGGRVNLRLLQDYEKFVQIYIKRIKNAKKQIRALKEE